jgi:plastocyanin
VRRRRALAIAFATVLVVVLGACGSSSKSNANEVKPPQPVDRRGQKSVTVDAQNNAFSPQVITVSPGTTVTWTNRDQEAHNHKKQSDVADFGGTFGVNVGDFGPGKTYSYTFDKPGTYAYMCTIHSLMTGTVIVDGSTATTNSTPTS